MEISSNSTIDTGNAINTINVLSDKDKTLIAEMFKNHNLRIVWVGCARGLLGSHLVEATRGSMLGGKTTFEFVPVPVRPQIGSVSMAGIRSEEAAEIICWNRQGYVIH